MPLGNLISSQLSSRDLVVILAISLPATGLAYVRQPKWKAILLSLPVPFTFMSWASGRPVDVTTVLGLDLFFVFMQAVRWLHQVRRVPIVPTIAVSALGYCLVGAGLAAVVPRTPAAYWLASAGSFALGALMFRLLPAHAEPGHRSALPVWIKWSIIAAIVLFLMVSRSVLQGFATVFPIMGTFSCYEARHSLWTVARQAAVIIMVLSLTLIVPYLSAPVIGLVPLTWLVWAAIFVPVSLHQWAHTPLPVVAEAEGA
jgi:hypothetical protein